MDKKNIIISSSEAGSVDYSQILEDSEKTARKSLSGGLTLIRYVGLAPESVVNLKNKSEEYDNDQILSILSGEDWTAPEEDDGMI